MRIRAESAGLIGEVFDQGGRLVLRTPPSGRDGVLRFEAPEAGRYELVVGIGGVPHRLVFDVSAERPLPWLPAVLALAILGFGVALRLRRFGSQTGRKLS